MNFPLHNNQVILISYICSPYQQFIITFDDQIVSHGFQLDAQTITSDAIAFHCDLNSQTIICTIKSYLL